MDDNLTLVNEAQKFLDSEVFAVVLKSLREEAYADIANSKPEENGERELRYQDLRALDRIKAKLQGYLDNHKLAERRNR
jgi:hypothetical protein